MPRCVSPRRTGACFLSCLPDLGRSGGLPFRAIMHSTRSTVPHLVPLLTLLAFVAFPCSVAQISRPPSVVSSLSKENLPEGWYARSHLPSWGCRCALTIPGGGFLSYTVG